MAGTPPRTMAGKIWDAHVVRSAPGEPDLLFIDLHLLHEVTSPQAFDGLRMSGRTVRRTDLTLAGEHNLENAMAAALPAPAPGVAAEAVRRGLAGLHRLPPPGGEKAASRRGGNPAHAKPHRQFRLFRTWSQPGEFLAASYDDARPPAQALRPPMGHAASACLGV